MVWGQGEDWFWWSRESLQGCRRKGWSRLGPGFVFI